MGTYILGNEENHMGWLSGCVVVVNKMYGTD